ncbi:hypothetical protein AAFF_G00266180 [Aldrovandia affinis]|uniref:Septin-type G domain-containing protein n=1 Tax=Aldrovandia affinis TaxID=143900 RepID=A0AAD7RBI5_9TELE|nr:hypothetical protein AAFF_G00266180 [Aldrovandia affinis]
MSDTSVNDHLEGILSDFEALKRSFDIDDEIPSFSPSPAHGSPFSPAPLSSRTNDGRGPANHTPPAYQSRISIGPSPTQSPVLKNKIVTSLSFNRGTAGAGVRANGSAGSGISRASSFQSRFNPNGFSSSSSSALGSDNDSLHSSSSSLDCHTSSSSSSSKPSPYASAAGLPQGPAGRRELRPPGLGGPALKKFSSHGNVFRSEAEVSSSGATGGEAVAVIHGSMPSLDLQSGGGGEGGGAGAGRGLAGRPLRADGGDLEPPPAGRLLLHAPTPGPEAQTPELTLASPPQAAQPAPSTPEAPGSGTASGEPCQEEPRANESTSSLNKEADGTAPVPKDDDRHGDEEKREGPVVEQKALDREEDAPPQAPEPQVQMAEKEEEEESEEQAPPPCPREPSPEGYIAGHQLFGYVGIEAVLDQMRRKAMKTGFEFNIMVVGQSGLGKSTLVNTLFKSKVSRKSCTPNYEEKISKTVDLQSVSHVIEEKGVKMKLTVIDTPGFGDQINNENCWEPIVKYINEQYEKYLKEELNINRKRRIPDTRVHCCVYFLPATGHWLRPIDVEFMKRLGLIVSIVPVIAKADTLTIEERLEFKQRIRNDLQANEIRVYPQTEYDEDGDDRITNDKIREKIPFAVVGTDKEHQVNGNKVLGRKTRWGIIEVENVAHCEFANLRDLLIRSHLQDLKDVTHNIHYETYRVRRLNENNINGLGLSPLSPVKVNGVAEKSEASGPL